MDRAALEALKDEVRRRRAKIAEYRARKGRLGEENTKVSLISPLLRALGWDVEDQNQVEHEYRHTPQDCPVDYALMLRGRPQVFVEAKALEESLEDRRWTNQMLTYATSAGVGWCVLTNGDEYRIYNAHARAPLEQKRLASVQVSEDATHDALVNILQLLSKEATLNQLLDEYWEASSVDRQVRDILRELLAGPDRSLARLVRKRSQGLSAGQVRLPFQRLRPSLEFAEQVVIPERSSAEKPKRRARRRGRLRGQVPGLPTQTALEVPLLRWLVGHGGEVSIREVGQQLEQDLANEFNVPETLRRITREGRSETVWSNRIRWTRMRLVHKGEIDGSRRGIWSVTEKGRLRVTAAREQSS